MASNGSEIEIWGDGEQTRSFMFVNDCIEGVHRLMQSDCRGPINLGTDRLVTINQLVDIVSSIAGKSLIKRHNMEGPEGVRGRNSDNTLLKQTLDWGPAISLEEGLGITYSWIESELAKSNRISL